VTAARGMDHDAALDYSQSLAQIGDGWWRQLVWAARQGIPEAMGMTVEEWRQTYYGHLHLPTMERREAIAELAAEGMTQREVAAVLGVGVGTVNRDLDVPDGTTNSGIADGRETDDVPDGTDDDPAISPPTLEMETPTDDKPWVALKEVVDSIGLLAKSYDATRIAAAVPARRRAATARRLRSIGTDLGRVAVALERMESSL
jgi:hypothetical protein